MIAINSISAKKSKVKVTLCEHAFRSSLSLFNFTHLWFHI